MDEMRDLVKHIIAYAMLQRASGVITDRQYVGIQNSLNVAKDDALLSIMNYVMHALNENYELKLKEYIESNRLIVRP